MQFHDNVLKNENDKGLWGHYHLKLVKSFPMLGDSGPQRSVKLVKSFPMLGDSGPQRSVKLVKSFPMLGDDNGPQRFR
jgi:hypothetical protein